MSGSSAAGEDIVQHLSSNSNPSSDKLAKLEARMAGKAVSVPPPSPPHHPVVSPASAPTFMDQEELPESSSSDDDNGDEFKIQKNVLKRPRSPDDDHDLALGNFEVSANPVSKILDVTEARLPSENPNRKKQGRGRGRAGTGRGRGSKAVDQTRQTSTSSVIVSNGQHDKLTNMDSRSSVLPGNDDRTALHEMAKKCYVVYIGRVPGVYEEWKDCAKQVNNFSGNLYQGYASREVAEEKWRKWTGHGRKKKWRSFIVIITALLLGTLVGYVLYSLS